MKTSFSIRIAFFFILSFLIVSCHRDMDALNMTFQKWKSVWISVRIVL